jgi:hypothetical protein
VRRGALQRRCGADIRQATTPSGAPPGGVGARPSGLIRPGEPFTRTHTRCRAPPCQLVNSGEKGVPMRGAPSRAPERLRPSVKPKPSQH